MSSVDKVLREIAEAVVNLDVDGALEASKRALSMGVDPVDIVERGVSEGLRVVGDKFERGEFFLMHLIIAAEAAKRVMEEVVEPVLLGRRSGKRLGVVVIGTVEGDIHDIGKSIVATMLKAAGFEVHDLGCDVPVDEFVKKAKEVDADIVAASALLSTTMRVQRDLVRALEEAGMRGRVKVLVGGAPVTREWAEEIGADGYAENAVEAVREAKRLMGIDVG